MMVVFKLLFDKRKKRLELARVEEIKRLGASEDVKAIYKLKEALKDGNPNVREAATEGLAKMHEVLVRTGQSDVERVVAMLNDK
jgi:HEAT repeat protein